MYNKLRRRIQNKIETLTLKCPAVSDVCRFRKYLFLGKFIEIEYMTLSPRHPHLTHDVLYSVFHTILSDLRVILDLFNQLVIHFRHDSCQRNLIRY